MKNILVTGAAGFIGEYIVREFCRHDHWHVLALIHSRGSDYLTELESKGRATLIKGDVTEVEQLEHELRNVLGGYSLNSVVHAAGRASDVGHRREFDQVNYQAVKQMAQLSIRMNVRRFVFISTTDVYGLADYHGEAEDQLPLSLKVSNPYPEFKIASEKWLRANLPSERYVIVRPAQVWGVGDQTLTPRIVDFLRMSPWIIHFGRWKGKNRWPLAHVINVARGTYSAVVLPSAAGQAVNIVDDEFTTIS